MGTIVRLAATSFETGLPPPTTHGEWQFKIGQCISHKDQPMPSLVMGMAKTSRGDEIYAVRSFATADPNRDRMMLAASLVDVEPGSEPCSDCMLHLTGICPGTLR